MLKNLKHLFDSKAAEFRDAVLGVVVSPRSGTWMADIPFQGGSISLLLPGSRQQPDLACLAHAHQTVAALPDLVRVAKEFAACRRPEISSKRLVLVALNYFRRVTADEFGLDFTEAGDDSGNCWQVDFRAGHPVELDYT